MIKTRENVEKAIKNNQTASRGDRLRKKPHMRIDNRDSDPYEEEQESPSDYAETTAGQITQSTVRGSIRLLGMEADGAIRRSQAPKGPSKQSTSETGYQRQGRNKALTNLRRETFGQQESVNHGSSQEYHNSGSTAQNPYNAESNRAPDRVFSRKARENQKQGINTVGRTGRNEVNIPDAPVKMAQNRFRVKKAAQARNAIPDVGKAVGKTTSVPVKSLVSGIRGLAEAIAAGSPVVITIVIICLIGVFVTSAFGIFLSGEDSGTGQTMQTAIREIENDYNTRIDTILASHAYDEVVSNSVHAPWPEILSVYSVKTAADPYSAQEVVSVDDTKKEILATVFWEMNRINDWTETIVTQSPVEGDADGETEEITITILHIDIIHMTAQEMADYYQFTETQRAYLTELLSNEYANLWSAVSYGFYNGNGEIVEVALSQVGNVGGDPYWSWYGFDHRVEWCACFVSWCADQCGYIDSGLVPKFAGCVQGSNWFKAKAQWKTRTYEPSPGDIIFFDWDNPDGFSGPQDGIPDHVGIVEKVENGTIYTVEGNSGNRCREKRYPIGYYEIYGYGIVNVNIKQRN